MNKQLESETSDGRDHLGRPRNKPGDNIKIILKKQGVGCGIDVSGSVRLRGGIL
jgi:hypothetical protein